MRTKCCSKMLIMALLFLECGDHRTVATGKLLSRKKPHVDSIFPDTAGLWTPNPYPPRGPPASRLENIGKRHSWSQCKTQERQCSRIGSHLYWTWKNFTQNSTDVTVWTWQHLRCFSQVKLFPKVLIKVIKSIIRYSIHLLTQIGPDINNTSCAKPTRKKYSFNKLSLVTEVNTKRNLKILRLP